MKKKIAIIGYGYVGRAMADLFQGAFDVEIYDPIGYAEGKERCLGADLAVICVPTPSLPDGRADVRAVEESVMWVDAPLILVKSTVPPGTCRNLSYLKGKAVHFSPEYIGEPSIPVSFKYLNPTDPTHHGFVIIGGPYPAVFFEFFQKVMPVDTKFISCVAIEAELAKYMENAYFAAKVTFCNEFARICEAFGVPYEKVRTLWLNDPRIEADHTAVFRDDPGFGGKCLPKDLDAIFMAAEGAGYTATFLASIMAVNDSFRKEQTMGDAYRKEPVGN